MKGDARRLRVVVKGGIARVYQEGGYKGYEYINLPTLSVVLPGYIKRV